MVIETGQFKNLVAKASKGLGAIKGKFLRPEPTVRFTHYSIPHVYIHSKLIVGALKSHPMNEYIHTRGCCGSKEYIFLLTTSLLCSFGHREL